MAAKKKRTVDRGRRIEREELKLIAVRIEPAHDALLEELAAADPERATVSVLIRRAIREYLQRQGKLKP